MLKNSTPYIFLLFILPFLGFSQDAPIGNNLYFDGSTEEVVAAGTIDDLKPILITLEFWIKPFDINSMSEIVRNFRDDDGQFTGFGIIKSPTGDGDVMFSAWTNKNGNPGNTNNRLSEIITLSLNTWNHIAATYDGNNIVIYLNGVPHTTTFSEYEIVAYQDQQTSGVRIGERGGFFRVDELRIWNKALTESQINAMKDYEIEKAADPNTHVNIINSGTITDLDFCDNLEVYYKFNEESTVNEDGTPNVAHDSSCNGISGTYGPGIDDSNIGDKDSGIRIETIVGADVWSNPNSWNTATIPSSNDVVLINDNISLDDTFSAQIAFVESNVTINPIGALTLGDNSLNESLDVLNIENTGTITIKSDITGTGSLITKGTITNSGIVNIERYSRNDYTSATGWNLISPAVTDASASVYNGHVKLFSHDERIRNTNYVYTEIPIDNLTALNSAEGYALESNQGESTITYTGSIYTGDKHINIYNTKYREPDMYYGWNLIGNPYASAIDWDIITASNIGKDINAAYYILKDGSDQWINYVDGMGWAKNILPIGQGFFVQTTNTSNGDNNVIDFIIPNDARTHNRTNGSFGKKSSNAHNNYFEINARTSEGLDKAFYRVKEIATEGFDGQYDAYKMISWNGNDPNIYFNRNNIELSICQEPSSESIPLGFSMNKNGVVELSVENVADFEEIILEDKLEGNFTNLINSNYSFDFNKSDNTSRFIIHLKSRSLIVDNLKSDNVKVYSQNNTLYLKGIKNIENLGLKIYDLNGKLIFNDLIIRDVNSYETNINANKGIYLVHLKGDNFIITKKIILK